ncbi:hypothetical protein PG990_008052 [Apiospora arundinis]
MRHLALSGVFVALLGSTSAQQYGGGDGSGGNPTSAPYSGPGGSSGGPGGSGGSGISIPGFGGTCPIPEPTTVFVTVTQPAVVLPPPTTVTVGVPNSPFGYTSGVSAVPGPQWPSGAPDQTLTVPCITGPDGQPIPSEPGLITVTYPAPPGGSPGVGTYSLITVPPSSQTGYPGGPFGVSSSPGGSGGQGLSRNSGWGSFGWPPEATVTVTAPEGSPAGPWGSIASTSPEGYGGTYPFPEPTLTLSYNPPPGGNGGGDQGGSSYLPTVTVTAPEGPPGGEGGSPGTVTNPYALPTITVTEPEGPPGGQGGSTGTFTNPYVLPTITVTEPEGGSGGSSVPGNPGGQGGTYPFPEPTLTLTYHPPGGGSPGSYGGQGWTTVTEGSIGPSSPFPEITVTIPPNGQTSAIPGGPGGQGWSSTPGGGFGPSNPFPEVTITAPPYGQGTAPPSGPSHSFPTITLTFSDTTLTFTYTDVPNKPQGTAPPGGQGWSSTSRGGFGPSNTLPEITITLPDTTLTVPYPYRMNLLHLAKVLLPLEDLEDLEVKDGVRLAVVSAQPIRCRESPSLFLTLRSRFLTQYQTSLAAVKQAAFLKAAMAELFTLRQLLSLPLEPHLAVEAQAALEAQLARLSPAAMDGQAQAMDREAKAKGAHQQFSLSHCLTWDQLAPPYLGLH